MYQYAVDTMGFFIDGDQLWLEYRDLLNEFLKDSPDRNKQGENILTHRKFYHKAVVVPCHSIHSSFLQQQTAIHSGTNTQCLRKTVWDLQSEIRRGERTL